MVTRVVRLHFAAGKIEDRLRLAVGGNAHSRCNLSFESPAAKKETPRRGSLFLVTRVVRLHFADGKIEDRLRPAVGGNAHPRCILSFESPAVKKDTLFRVSFLVTRWRFELQTHCLKGNCSAN